jgi:hypothetical protein
MSKLAIIQAVMPIAKLLLEKLFDLLQNDAKSYDSKPKTDESTKEFLDKVQDKLPEIEKIFKENNIDFKTSGDLDHSTEVQTLINSLEDLKGMTTNPSDVVKLDKLINSLEDARDHLKTQESAGKSTGDRDYKIDLKTIMPTQPGGVDNGVSYGVNGGGTPWDSRI